MVSTSMTDIIESVVGKLSINEMRDRSTGGADAAERALQRTASPQFRQNRYGDGNILLKDT